MKKILMLSLACVLGGSALAQEGKTYTPGTFDLLNISGIAKIELVQGSPDQVFIAGNDDVQRSVKLSLTGTRLDIRTDDNWKFWTREPVQMKVQMRELSKLVISGASEVQAPKGFKADTLIVHISGQGLVRMQDLHANRLRFDVSGAGDGDMSGQVGELLVRVSGKGKMVADKLLSKKAVINISGIGNADVWVTDELKIGVSGIGSVNYWGRPLVQRTESGLADVTAKGEKKP